MIALWDWALAAYARPGVQASCLALQDDHDQNVCYLLWAAWAADNGRPLDADTLEAGADAARAWEGAVVRPLRLIRRQLAKPIPDLDDPAREAVRGQIKTVELDAERRLLLQLEALAPDSSGARRPLSTGLIDAARAWTRVTPRAEIETLARCLSA